MSISASSLLVNGGGGIQSAHLRRLIGAVVFHYSWVDPERETRQGVRAPLRGHKNTGVLSNAGPGSLGGRRAAGPVFNGHAGGAPFWDDYGD